MPQRGPSTSVVIILVGGMLVCGASNSIFSKWQDVQCVMNCTDPDVSKRVNFEQPVWQTATMFLGELLCLFAFWFINSRFNPFRPASRATASAAQRRAVLASEQNRLAAAPLSRPDESAFDFGESAISLRNEEPYDIETNKAAPQSDNKEGANWAEATLFWGPACCDIIGTTLMNAGLLFVPVSIHQMMRGALVLWVGLLSVIFLKRPLAKSKWLALGTVMLGVAVVGASSIGEKKKEEAGTTSASAGSPLIGIIMILSAQVFTASQFVIEEKVMEKHSVDPMLAVGYEGWFGFATTLFAMPFLHYFFGRTPTGEGNLGFFDIGNGFKQIFDNSGVWMSSVAIMISIALFNFCGLAVTSAVSATARSTIDTSRTCIIWVISLMLGWEHFKWLQVVGFGLLVYGTFIFNGLTRFPAWTGFHDSDFEAPTVTLSDEGELEDEEEEERTTGRSRSVDATGRPIAKRAGSGRRGEISPLLKNTVAT
ncbi:hypothetical protein T439DRAFT_310546 [Meredithblackwellia eburnea MCA 4105]